MNKRVFSRQRNLKPKRISEKIDLKPLLTLYKVRDRGLQGWAMEGRAVAAKMVNTCISHT